MNTTSLPTWAVHPAPCLNCGTDTRYRAPGDSPLCHWRPECKGPPAPFGYSGRQIAEALKAQSFRPGRQNWRNRP